MNTKSGSLRPARSSGGFILVSVLLSVTLLLTSATAFAWFAKNEMKRTETEKLMLQTRSAAEIGCGVIAELIARDKNGYDSAAERLYMPGAETRLELGDYKIAASVHPLDDKIPAAGLFLPDGVTVRGEYEEAWTSVWDHLGQSELGTLVLDFMDSDEKQKLGGSERAGNINRPVSDLTELKLLPEVTDGVLYGTKDIPGGLSRYLTVYGKDKININVANPEVIAILDKRIDVSQAGRLTAYRLVNPLKSLDDLKKVPGFPVAAATKLANVIGFESSHFRVDMSVGTPDGRRRNFRIILERAGASCRIVRWEE